VGTEKGKERKRNKKNKRKVVSECSLRTRLRKENSKKDMDLLKKNEDGN